MAKKTKLPPMPAGGFHYPWYLREWLETLEVSQAELGRRADLGKATISDLVGGKLQYSQTHLDRIAWELKVRPHELLLHPEQAFTIRKLEQAHQAVVSHPTTDLPSEPAALRIWRR